MDPSLIQPMYGSPTTPYDTISEMLPQIFLIATLPIVLTVGLIIYFKKKRKKK